MNTTTAQREANNASAAVSMQGVTVVFASPRGVVTALRDISLEIKPEEFVAILGPSGCGKSTLLRAIAQLVTPVDGRISVLGGSPESARKDRRLGFVFQDPTLLPWRSVLQNVLLPLEIAGESNRDTRRAAEALLSLVGLAGRERAYPHELSGGMRQRVSIARALVSKPQVLLMDEPFGALDELTREQLNLELLRIWQRTGTTILFVTHSIPEAAFLAQRVVVLSPSPGSVHSSLEVPMPYPRSIPDKESPQFVKTAARLRRALEQSS